MGLLGRIQINDLFQGKRLKGLGVREASVLPQSFCLRTLSGFITVKSPRPPFCGQMTTESYMKTLTAVSFEISQLAFSQMNFNISIHRL